MIHHKIFLIFLMTLISATGISAQNTPNEPQTAELEFSPYITNLEGEIKNNLLRLTWTDSPEAKGPVYIYRSNSPFEENKALAGRPTEVPYGIESYIDEIDDSGVYHYLVIASGADGQRYDYYILPDNTICIQMTGSIELTGVRNNNSAAANQPATPGASVSNIRALAENNRIVISFRSEADVHPVLYRGIRPIRNTSDLLGAVIIQSNVTSPFYDSPVPGIPYYYALVPANELARGTIMIRPGTNATVEPVETAGAEPDPAGVRTVPLPLISLATAVPGSMFMETSRQPQNLSPDVINALENIPAYQKETVPARDSLIFPQDLETTGGGEDYLLGSIIQGNFVNREWANAAEELARFLSLPRSRTTEARARYYLGQCLFFNGSSREALFEFLSARSVYPDAAAEWIQIILRNMAE